MGKRQKENIPSGKKYPWQFWVMVSAVIAVMAGIILLACLSIKAIVQNVQMCTYENKAEGTVSVAEFVEGGFRDGQQIYEKIHYVITFDGPVAGYRQYEYRASDMIDSRKYIGDRYIVLFDDIEDSVLIREGAVMTDNVILLLFIVMLIAAVIFRKELYVRIKEVEQRLDKYL